MNRTKWLILPESYSRAAGLIFGWVLDSGTSQQVLAQPPVKRHGPEQVQSLGGREGPVQAGQGHGVPGCRLEPAAAMQMGCIKTEIGFIPRGSQ